MIGKVMVTGGTGYLGSWVVKYLLEAGYHVHVALRNPDNHKRTEHLEKLIDKAKGSLSYFKADLMEAGSYHEAAKDCDAVIHLASPFSVSTKNAKELLIDPALEGTRNVLSAVSASEKVKKVVLTSSVMAIYGDTLDMKKRGLVELSEEHFNETSSEKHQPYSYSKVLAEKEAWRLHDEQDRWALSVINPSFIMGPALSPHTSSFSLDFMSNLLNGKYAMGLPNIVNGWVDVRDVARAHIEALKHENADGRHIISKEEMSLFRFSQQVKALYGARFKLPKSASPKVVLYLIGWALGMSPKYIKNNAGHPLKFNNRKAIERFGLKYRSLDDTIKDMVSQMEAAELIKA